MADLDWDVIRESLRIEEALDALAISTHNFNRGGYWDKCPLPGHPGVDRSGQNFSVHATEFVWHCFTCDDGGLLPALVQRIRGCDWDEALGWLVEFSDADPRDEDAFVKQIEGYLKRPSKVAIKGRGGETLPFFSESILAPYRGYGEDFWATRGVTSVGMKLFNLGYDPERTRHDYTGPAALIPHYFNSDLVGYQERWVDYGTDGFPKSIPKYTNSPDFPRKSTLFNYDWACRACQPVLVVESVITVIRLAQLGIPAVASFGGALNDYQLILLSTLRHGAVYARDNDDTGRKAAIKFVSVLGSKIPTWVLPPVPGTKADLGDLSDQAILAHVELMEPAFLY